MARAVHRVSVVVMPAGVEEVRDGEGLLAALRGAGLAGAGRAVSGEVRFYSSGLGGFRVDCPADGRVVTAGFARALEGWRRGGERGMLCAGGCGGWHRLEELQFRPECGFARTAVVLADAEEAGLPEAAWEVVRREWGGGRVVVQRG